MAIVNFHLTAFPADFGQIISSRRCTNTHKHSQRKEKTAENDPLRFAILGSCFPEKSSWTLTADPSLWPHDGFESQGPLSIRASLDLNSTNCFPMEESDRYA